MKKWIYLLIPILMIFIVPTVSATWYDNDYVYCQEITLAATSSQTNFPYKIDVDYNSNMQADFDDIRFVNAGCDSGGSLMTYELNSKTDSTSAVYWVLIPSLTNGMTISMYYGNSGVSSAAVENATWVGGYEAVYHLENGEVETDATSNGNTASEGNTDSATGQIGSGRQFRPADDPYFNKVGSSSYTNFMTKGSVSMLAKFEDTPAFSETDYFLFAQGGGTCGTRNYLEIYNTGSNRLLTSRYEDYPTCASPDQAINQWISDLADGNWHHVAYEWDTGTPTFKIYADGDLKATSGFNPDDQVGTNWMFIGSVGGTAGEWYGDIDEIRTWDNINKGEDYWLAEAYNYLSGGASFGSEEVNPYSDMFDYCRVINISSVASGNLTDYPALVRITDMTHVNADYVRFADNDTCWSGGSPMDYELEGANSTEGNYWVRIPTLEPSGKQVAFYYGNNTAISNGQNIAGVWDGSYKAVYHMYNISGSLFDSKGWVNATATGAVHDTTNAEVWLAQDYNGASQYHMSGDDNIVQDLTVEAWVNVDAYADYDMIYYHDNSGAAYAPWRLMQSTAVQTKIYARVTESDCSTTHTIDPGGGRPTDEWMYWVLEWDYSDAQIDLFLNATNIGSGDFGSNIALCNPGGTTYAYLMGSPSVGDTNGIMDEFRLSSTRRSQDYLEQTYQIILNQDTMVDIGDEEPYVPTDTCIPYGIGTWNIDCSNNCVWNSTIDISGNISTFGSGVLNLESIFNFTSSSQYMFINSGCELIINSGGGFS